MLLAKIPPGHTKGKWARCMLSIRIRQLREFDLVDFIEFAKVDTLLENYLLFLKSAIDQYCEISAKYS